MARINGVCVCACACRIARVTVSQCVCVRCGRVCAPVCHVMHTGGVLVFESS